MPRPPRCRRISGFPEYESFMPDGIPCAEAVELALDELETIRLMDLEGLSHEQAAVRMDISRTTVTEIYERARRKVAQSLLLGKPLVFSGGRVSTPTANVPVNPKLLQKGAAMRIALPYDNGEIAHGFGRAPQFKIYDVDESKNIVQSSVMDNPGGGHGPIAVFMNKAEVNTVICAGIGQGAITTLSHFNIQIVAGVAGEADAVVAAYLRGEVTGTDQATSGHGHHGAGCGGHHHGEGEGCGCGGHHHGEGEGCGCGGHHHGEGEGCGCGDHHHGEGEGCGCGGHHHGKGEGCGCGHHGKGRGCGCGRRH